MTRTEIQKMIRNFVVTELITGEENASLKDDDSLLRHQAIDSVSILQLIAFVDSQFDLRVESIDIHAANFDSIERLAAYVRGKLESTGEQREKVAA